MERVVGHGCGSGRGAMTSVLVVGAGISGLLCARTVRDAGLAVTVLDKGRGVGGRMATRRVDGAVFDHGAQFFTCRDEGFAAVVRDLADAGAAHPWFRGLLTFGGGVVDDGGDRYRGDPTMTAPAKALAAGLSVRTDTRVVAVTADGDRWVARSEDGAADDADVLVLTAPVPQSVALLDAGDVRLPRELRARLDRVVYDPCLAVLATLAEPTTLPDPGALRPAEEPVVWITDNQRKGISPVPAVTIHAGPHTSRDLWDEPDAVVVRELTGAVRPLGVGEPRTAHVVRWRYATPIDPLPERCLTTTAPLPLVLAGDAFGGPRVEGAALSGLAAGMAAATLGRGLVAGTT